MTMDNPSQEQRTKRCICPWRGLEAFENGPIEIIWQGNDIFVIKKECKEENKKKKECDMQQKLHVILLNFCLSVSSYFVVEKIIYTQFCRKYFGMVS